MLITTIIAIILIKLKIRKNKNLKKMAWLLGNWEAVIGDETFTEFWMRNKKYDYECMRRSSHRKLISETYYIIEKNETLILILIIHQNDQIQVYSFRMESITDEQVTFSNNEFNFPCCIIYTRMDDQTMRSEMLGVFMEKEYMESHIFIRKQEDQSLAKKTNIIYRICRKMQKKSSGN